jgi:hypothetical protein
MLKKRCPGTVEKRNFNANAAGRSSCSAGTVNAASRYAPGVLRKTNGA